MLEHVIFIMSITNMMGIQWDTSGGFQSMGVPPVLIHFRLGFSMK